MRVVDRVKNFVTRVARRIYRDPHKLRQFRAEVTINMNVRLTWAWPNVSNRQRPIKEAVIEGRVAGIDVWTEINRVAGDATAELLIENIAPGDWEFRGRAVDDLGQESDNVTASVSVPFDNPDPLVSFSAAVE